MTNILLFTSLISLLTNSLARVRLPWSSRCCWAPCRISDWLMACHFLNTNTSCRYLIMRGKSIYSCQRKSTPTISNKILPSNLENSYSVYVLEASTSNRLTYYFPPLVSDEIPRSVALQIKRRGSLLSCTSHQRVRFLRLHETISPSMALVYRYPFGPRSVILANAFITVGLSRNICWPNLAHR